MYIKKYTYEVYYTVKILNYCIYTIYRYNGKQINILIYFICHLLIKFLINITYSEIII